MNTIAVTVLTLFVGLCTGGTSAPSTHKRFYIIKHNASNETQLVRMIAKPTQKPNERPDVVDKRPAAAETCPSHNVRPGPARPAHGRHPGPNRSNHTTGKPVSLTATATATAGHRPATVPTDNGTEPDLYALRRGRAAFGVEFDLGAMYAV